jgi:Tfp pilus assembly protein PilX
MNSPSTSRRRGQRGIGLIEALISLLVLALGMMSFAALQARLRLNSDVAKQRAEAVRLAQEQIEGLRSFGTLAGFDGVGSGSSTVTAGSIASNTTYTITRQVADAPRAAGLTNAPVKNLLVTVTWNDRNGNAQSVIFRTMIARSDPAIAASLALSPNGSPVRDLLGRDIQVPIPAQNLGNGTSAVKPVSSGSVAYIFNNDTGVVTQRCEDNQSQPAPSDPTLAGSVTANLSLQLLQSANISCTDIYAYLVSGFIRTYAPPNLPENAPGTIAVRVDLDNTSPPAGAQGTLAQLTAAYWPSVGGATGVTVGSGSTTYTPAECNTEALQNVRYRTPVSFTQANNGNTTSVVETTVIASIPQSVTSLTPANVAAVVGTTAANVIDPQPTGDRFIAYACLIYPIDLDLSSTTALAFTARTTLWPTSSWTIGTTDPNGNNWKVCRYSADYNSNGGVYVASGVNVARIDNEEHTYAYLNAQRSLSNQNFFLTPISRTCPTDGAVEVNGTGGENYTDETTVTHQP